MFSEKLSSLLDSSKASRLAEKVFEIVEDTKSIQRSRKRHHEAEIENNKKAKMDSVNTNSNNNSNVTISSGPLSANEVG